MARLRIWGFRLAALALVIWPEVTPRAQAPVATVAGNRLQVRAPDFHFIKGSSLDRLKDGLALRIELELVVLTRPGGAATLRGRERFSVSYDLWEERFAITELGTGARAVSHLKASDAEAWCVDAVARAVGPLDRLDRSAPFWTRLAYRVDDAPDRLDDPPRFTLRGLIDRMSRRAPSDAVSESVESGPFRFPSP